MNASTTPIPFDPEHGHPHRRRILGVICLALLIVVIDGTILNTALPSIARSLHATTTDLQWITDGFTLTFAALLIFAGALGDRYGRRHALMAGLAVFGAGSVGAALSSSAVELIAFRAVMGVGGALVMPTTLSILNTVFPAKERPLAIAAWSAIAGVGVILGPTAGGVLLDQFTWSSVFYVNVPLVAIALTAVLTVIPPLPGRRAAGSKLDIPGAAVSALTMLVGVDTIIEGPNHGWLSPRTLVQAALTALLLSAFISRELRLSEPLIDLRVFVNRAFSAATAAVTVTFFALFGSLFALTQFLQLVQGHSPLGAGLRALPFGLGVMIASPVSSVLGGRVGVRRIVPSGMLSMACGLFVLTSATPTTGLLTLSIGIGLMGIGMGLIIAPAGELMLSVLPEEQSGVGSAVNDTVQELGGSLGVAVIGSLVAAAYRTHIAAAGLPVSIAHGIRSSIAAADAIAVQVPHLAPQITTTAHNAFTAAMTSGFAITGSVAAVGAIALYVVLPSHATSEAEATSDPGSLAAATPLADELLQPLRVISLHPAVLITPPMERRLGDRHLLRDLRERLPRAGHPLSRPQLTDDCSGVFLRASRGIDSPSRP